MKFWNKFGRYAAVAVLALVLASCDHTVPTDVEAPIEAVEMEPQELLGLDGLLGGLLGGSTTVRAIDQYGTIRTYTLVREPLLTTLVNTVVQTVDGLLVVVTDLLGGDGGSLDLLGHRLVVPAGAVDQPTTFTLGVLLNGTTRVDLTAFAPGRSGNVDVGAEGFDRPVRLDMTYKRGMNIRDERKLVILRLNPAGIGALHEVLPTTVDRTRDRATTWLEHFSGYAMAM
jgi:hypothetical protein